MHKSGSKHKESKDPPKKELSNKQKKKLAAEASKKQTSSSAPTPASQAGTSHEALWEKTTLTGNKIRELKAAKAPKEEVLKEVEVLKALKAEYKAATGSDYDANKKPVSIQENKSSGSSGDHLQLWEGVTKVGNKIRELKAAKASKEEVMKQVTVLKELKAAYKEKTGGEYDANKKPSASPAVQPSPVEKPTGDLSLWEKVTEQ